MREKQNQDNSRKVLQVRDETLKRSEGWQHWRRGGVFHAPGGQTRRREQEQRHEGNILHESGGGLLLRAVRFQAPGSEDGNLVLAQRVRAGKTDGADRCEGMRRAAHLRQVPSEEGLC